MIRDNKSDEEIIKRLNILIALFIERSSAGTPLSMTEKIGKLNNLGVSQTDIARILGKPPNYITAILSQRKSKKKGKTNG
jgi:hypothetical protein